MAMHCLVCGAKTLSIPCCPGACVAEINYVLTRLLPHERPASAALARLIRILLIDGEAAAMIAVGQGDSSALSFLKGAFHLIADRLGDTEARSRILQLSEN